MVGHWRALRIFRGSVSGGTLSQRGTWLPGQTGFAGLGRPAGGGDYQYGWIRMRVDDLDFNNTPDMLTIFDYAYETDVNTPIKAGQTVATPEPTSTALLALALAGAGAAALRRRRK